MLILNHRSSGQILNYGTKMVACSHVIKTAPATFTLQDLGLRWLRTTYHRLHKPLVPILASTLGWASEKSHWRSSKRSFERGNENGIQLFTTSCWRLWTASSILCDCSGFDNHFWCAVLRGRRRHLRSFTYHISDPSPIVLCLISHPKPWWARMLCNSHSVAVMLSPWFPPSRFAPLVEAAV